MISKSRLRLYGLITLLVFPLPAFLVLYFVDGVSLWEILDIKNLHLDPIALGIAVGMLYAVFVLAITQSPVFEPMSSRMEQLVRNMNLTIFDCIFISICAGVGEELLFRAGVQYYLGPWITSVLFVAVHGYINPLSWRKSLTAVVVLPFILIISFAMYEFGLWFSIGAHFSYDLVLFLMMRDSSHNNS